MAIKLQDLVSEIKLEDKLSPASKGVLSSLKGIGVGIGAVTAILGTAALGMKKLIDLSFDWARKLDGVQDVMGGTTKQAAAFNFVLQKSGTDVSQFTNGMTILEKGLVDAEGKLDLTGKKLAEFGINALETNGAVKDQASLVEEISNKYNHFGTQQERVNFLTEVFGKSGAGLIDFFDTLANEGGLDATTEKVEKFGLAIDPAKYETFTRNIEEIKLAGQGLAITFIDKLMPALDDFSGWWTEKGLPATMSMIDWVDKNGLRWESLKETWTTHVSPALVQVMGLLEKINGIMERLDPSTEKVAGKFTMLGVVQRLAVSIATLVNSQLERVEKNFEAINKVIEKAIGLWDAFRAVSQMANGTYNPMSPPTSNTGRATSGAVLAGVNYNVVELNKPEVFTPFTGGRIDEVKPQTVTANIDVRELTRAFRDAMLQIQGA